MPLTEEQLQIRQQGLGASETPIVMLGSVYGIDRVTLWMQKTGKIPRPPLGGPDIRRGHRQEPVAAQVYTEITGRELFDYKDTFADDQYPFLLCTPDRKVAGRNKGVEIKVPRGHTYRKYKREGIPSHIIIQAAQQIRVMNWDSVDVAVYSPEEDELLTVEILRDDDLITQIIDETEAFWRCVEEDSMPSVYVPPPDLKVPEAAKGEIVICDRIDWRAAVELFREAKGLESEAALLLEDAKQRIIDLMGEDGMGDAVEGAGLRVYYREQKGKNSLDKAALKKDYPDLDLDKYMKRGKPSRPFKTYFLDK